MRRLLLAAAIAALPFCLPVLAHAQDYDTDVQTYDDGSADVTTYSDDGDSGSYSVSPDGDVYGSSGIYDEDSSDDDDGGD